MIREIETGNVPGYPTDTAVHYSYSGAKLTDLGPFQTTGVTSPEPVAGIKAFPNPFHNGITLQFRLNRPETATLEIYNVLGQKVAGIIEHTPLLKGAHTFNWQPDNSQAAGNYFYRLQLGGKVKTGELYYQK